jgi:hypothetical protein
MEDNEVVSPRPHPSIKMVDTTFFYYIIISRILTTTYHIDQTEATFLVTGITTHKPAHVSSKPAAHALHMQATSVGSAVCLELMHLHDRDLCIELARPSVDATTTPDNTTPRSLLSSRVPHHHTCRPCLLDTEGTPPEAGLRHPLDPPPLPRRYQGRAVKIWGPVQNLKIDPISLKKCTY